MTTLSSYETNDMYLTSALSLSCLILFVVVKFNAPWSKEIYLLCLIGAWIALELSALILFSLQHSRKVKLPQPLARSINTILATASMWGVAIIQILTIIYTFAVIGNEVWWKSAAAIECVEVALILLLAPIPQIPTPVELAYILPFTSQITAMGVIWVTSRGISRKRVPKHMADHLLGLSLITILISATLLPLSLIGYFPRWMTLQWMLFMVITTVAYRLPESSDQNPSPSSDSEIELTTSSHPPILDRSLPEPSLNLDGRPSLSSRPPLPPDSKASVSYSYDKQEFDFAS